MNLFPTPEDLVAEFDAATWAVKERPEVYAGVARKSGQELQDWLTNVAFWRAYPETAGKKLAAGDAIGTAVWLRLRVQVQQLLAAAEPLPWTRSAPTWPLDSTPRTKFKTGSKFSVKRPWEGTTKRHHCGVDIGVPQGTRVFAPEAGVIAGEIGWEDTVKALILQTDSGLTVLLGGIIPKSGIPKGTRVQGCQDLGTCGTVARIGAYPRGSTMLHFQLYDRVLTLAEVEKRKSWPWNAPKPDALIDPEPYLITAARRTELSASGLQGGFVGLSEDEAIAGAMEGKPGVEADPSGETAEGADVGAGAGAVSKPASPGGGGGGLGWLGLGALLLAGAALFRRR